MTSDPSIGRTLQLRLARPVSDLDRSVAMYCAGLGLEVLGSFREHSGFDGTMLGQPGADVHFEFVVCRAHPVEPSPTPEDLVVLYVPESAEWAARCSAVVAAGFKEVQPFNPYWSERGRTFEDPDGYRVVLQNAAWGQEP
jgi:catechol 2,3-dioxygenase-like lactoylglutathione lyase family enzyme